MRRSFAGLLAAAPLAAHVMSMSTGELRLAGDRAEYRLRMPLYEIAHIQEPQKSLFENLRLFDGRREARMLKHFCEASAVEDAYLCRAEYQFPAPVQDLEVQCSFAAITVPNHVHLLRAERGGVSDQAVFDFNFTRVAVKFAPP